ncbi:MAG: tetratricopeptide repeat protein [Chloroflexi bacterium]|nr:tetratricopeptide repeat protein [Chloroflexota bacterium]
MALEQAEERAKIRREKSKAAIALAMESRWEEAVAVNRAILGLFPDDVEAHNRLGKALVELGDYRQARLAFHKALELAPSNTIARKNLERLALLGKEQPQAARGRKLTPQEFLAESGKTGVVVLESPASPRTLAKMAPGDPVLLRVAGNRLVAESAAGEYLGEIGPRIGRRVVRLMGGGNRYEAVVTRVGDGELAVLVREVYQSPDQRGIVSFPSRGVEPFPSESWNALAEFEGAEEEDEEVEVEAAPESGWEESDAGPARGSSSRGPARSPEELANGESEEQE